MDIKQMNVIGLTCFTETECKNIISHMQLPIILLVSVSMLFLSLFIPTSKFMQYCITSSQHTTIYCCNHSQVPVKAEAFNRE